MAKYRTKMLKKSMKHEKNTVASNNTCSIENQKTEQFSILINGINIRERLIDVTSERDGVKICYRIKQVFC